jgi:hypothetical protein
LTPFYAELQTFPEEAEMQKNHTNVKGNVSESAALNAFSKAGFVVSVPFGNGAPSDR